MIATFYKERLWESMWLHKPNLRFDTLRYIWQTKDLSLVLALTLWTLI